MTDKVFDNNQVTIAGEIMGGFTFSHDVFGEGFYVMDISVGRLSESNDIIPIMVSERLVDVKKDYTGMQAVISGQFRSYNRHEELKNRLVLSVFAREVEFIDEELDGGFLFGLADIFDDFVCVHENLSLLGSAGGHLIRQLR